MTQLRYAWICIDCDEIFDVKIIKNNTCPRCGSAALQMLTKWLPSMPEIKEEIKSIPRHVETPKLGVFTLPFGGGSA